MFTILHLDNSVFRSAEAAVLAPQAHQSVIEAGLSSAIFPKPPVRFNDKNEYVAPNPSEVTVATIVTWYSREHINHMLRYAGLSFDIADRRVITPDAFAHLPAEKRPADTLEAMIRMALTVRLDSGDAGNVTFITDSDAGADTAARIGIGVILRYAAPGAASQADMSMPTMKSFHGFTLK
ncbi:MAG TPA: hypothetical protein VIN59_04310 [Alphaproteobacteria bacterium]